MSAVDAIDFLEAAGMLVQVGHAVKEAEPAAAREPFGAASGAAYKSKPGLIRSYASEEMVHAARIEAVHLMVQKHAMAAAAAWENRPPGTPNDFNLKNLGRMSPERRKVQEQGGVDQFKSLVVPPELGRNGEAKLATSTCVFGGSRTDFKKTKPGTFTGNAVPVGFHAMTEEEDAESTAMQKRGTKQLGRTGTTGSTAGQGSTIRPASVMTPSWSRATKTGAHRPESAAVHTQRKPEPVLTKLKKSVVPTDFVPVQVASEGVPANALATATHTLQAAQLELSGSLLLHQQAHIIAGDVRDDALVMSKGTGQAHISNTGSASQLAGACVMKAPSYQGSRIVMKADLIPFVRVEEEDLQAEYLPEGSRRRLGTSQSGSTAGRLSESRISNSSLKLPGGSVAATEAAQGGANEKVAAEGAAAGGEAKRSSDGKASASPRASPSDAKPWSEGKQEGSEGRASKKSTSGQAPSAERSDGSSKEGQATQEEAAGQPAASTSRFTTVPEEEPEEMKLLARSSAAPSRIVSTSGRPSSAASSVSGKGGGASVKGSESNPQGLSDQQPWRTSTSGTGPPDPQVGRASVSGSRSAAPANPQQSTSQSGHHAHGVAPSDGRGGMGGAQPRCIASYPPQKDAPFNVASYLSTLPDSHSVETGATMKNPPEGRLSLIGQDHADHTLTHSSPYNTCLSTTALEARRRSRSANRRRPTSASVFSSSYSSGTMSIGPGAASMRAASASRVRSSGTGTVGGSSSLLDATCGLEVGEGMGTKFKAVDVEERLAYQSIPNGGGLLSTLKTTSRARSGRLLKLSHAQADRFGNTASHSDPPAPRTEEVTRSKQDELRARVVAYTMNATSKGRPGGKVDNEVSSTVRGADKEGSKPLPPRRPMSAILKSSELRPQSAHSAILPSTFPLDMPRPHLTHMLSGTGVYSRRLRPPSAGLWAGRPIQVMEDREDQGWENV